MSRWAGLVGAAVLLTACAPDGAGGPDAARPPEVPQHIPYCPEGTPVTQIRCSDSISGTISADDVAMIGGTCADGRCYSCGTPFAALEQTGVEDVYEFWCQRIGSVTVRVSGATCDVDAYVLDVGCNPYDHCLAGHTGFGTSDRTLTFDCTTTLYPFYIVVEQGWCTEGSYTVSIDLDGVTCLEDCVDGVDNDGDGKIDCGDFDCARHPGCPCDVDGDGSFAEDCGGDDCDDENERVFPGLWDGCDGIDNDCDGLIDESPALPCAPDAGPTPDAAVVDAGPPDASAADAGIDAAIPDAGPIVDASAVDAAWPDAAPADATAPDATSADATPADAAVSDAGIADAAVADASSPAADAMASDAAVAIDATPSPIDGGRVDDAGPRADAGDGEDEPSGCGCRAASGSAPPGGTALLYLVVAACVVSGRRRRSG